ncbi:alkylation response protein AidB-like acyl-CoA dehydrogenase [Catenulispora sp. MAP12-49]|uniref:acyl-CoA dehydrogenase family protein n=1 Tax=unclassified Catenulispora TaxID=414885 RepID=UPI0035149A5A
MVAVDRTLPSDESRALFDLVQDLCAKELAPRAAEYEAAERFPREVFRTLGQAGLLSLPYDEKYGGGGQPYEVYLQVVEELARNWLTIGLGVSVHSLACYGLANFGSQEQKGKWLPDMLGGDQLGAYCLSEPQSGSDAAALTTRAVRSGDASVYTVNGTKAWITHSGQADFYTLMVRTSDDGAKGISALLAERRTPGMSFGKPENKMGMRGSVTAQVLLDGAQVPADRLIGTEGQGFSIALSALEAGRLGIAACAVGVAQAALDAAVEYAISRQQFGKAISEFQGVGFMLADMATSVAVGRAAYLAAARRRDAGLPYGTEAAMAKLFCTDMAMKVTTDAVQVFGGYGYTADFPVERYMREAKVLQIVEGTNQVQRLVISRTLTRP